MPRKVKCKEQTEQTPKIIRMIEKKLGRQCAYGQSYLTRKGHGIVAVDPRQTPKCRLDTIIHEFLHHVLPNGSETRVTRLAGQLTSLLWQDGYRRVDGVGKQGPA